MPGEANQRKMIGAANPSAAGALSANAIAIAVAMTGAIHIDPIDVPVSAADAFQSRSRRRDTSIRHAVRAMASRWTVASYGRNASVSTAWAACRPATPAVMAR